MKTKEIFLINKELALLDYDKFINDNETYYIGIECTINRGIFNRDENKIYIMFDMVSELIFLILTAIQYTKLSWSDFNISENILKDFDRNSNKYGFDTKENVIKFIDSYNFMVSRCLSLKKLNDKLKFNKIYPKPIGYKRDVCDKHNKIARYKKLKKRNLPRKVWWDLGEDLEFIKPELVKQFKEYYVNYYIYYENDKYIRRSSKVEKYKLMFQRMSEMQSKYNGLPK